MANAPPRARMPAPISADVEVPVAWGGEGAVFASDYGGHPFEHERRRFAEGGPGIGSVPRFDPVAELRRAARLQDLTEEQQTAVLRNLRPTKQGVVARLLAGQQQNL